MSREWEEVRLDEIGTIVTGKTPSTKVEENFGKEYPFITPRDMDDMKYVRITERYLSKQGIDSVEKQVLKGTSICVSCIGSDMGKVMLSKGICVTNQQINSITKIKENYDIDFIYYSLKPLKEFFHKIAGGSTMPIVNKSRFSEITIPMPPLEEQKAIAHILSTLDEKIETNNQINKTLEKMAQTIFKHWFVDFEFPNENGEAYKSSGGAMVESELGIIPRGWAVGKLEDIAIITMGQSPKGSSYNEHGDGTVFYQGCTDFMNRFPVRRLYTTEPKRIARDGDILMSVRAPVGDINIANEECCIGRGLCSFRSKDNIDSYLLYTLLNLKEQFNIFNGEGTVFGSINQKDLKAIKVIMPNNSIITNFNDIATSLDKKYLCLEKESRILIQLRDLLLPKLMSGEIRVPLKGDDIS